MAKLFALKVPINFNINNFNQETNCEELYVYKIRNYLLIILKY